MPAASNHAEGGSREQRVERLLRLLEEALGVADSLGDALLVCAKVQESIEAAEELRQGP